MRVSQNQDWKVIYPKFPRVYHLGGECGYHTKESDFCLQVQVEIYQSNKTTKKKQTCNTDQVMQKLGKL